MYLSASTAFLSRIHLTFGTKALRTKCVSPRQTSYLYNCLINNFISDWKDGKAVGALVDSVAPGLCPNWEDWDPNRPLENATEVQAITSEDAALGGQEF
mgnify:CR=1 FL=1